MNDDCERGTTETDVEISRRKFLKKAAYTVPAIITISLTGGSKKAFGIPPPPISGTSAPNVP